MHRPSSRHSSCSSPPTTHCSVSTELRVSWSASSSVSSNGDSSSGCSARVPDGLLACRTILIKSGECSALSDGLQGRHGEGIPPRGRVRSPRQRPRMYESFTAHEQWRYDEEQARQADSVSDAQRFIESVAGVAGRAVGGMGYDLLSNAKSFFDSMSAEGGASESGPGEPGSSATGRKATSRTTVRRKTASR